MKKLTVKLKQHTPLIHFQHEQHGATLRASEVKPKLDKFIVKSLFNDEFDKCKRYLIGYQVLDDVKKQLEFDEKLRVKFQNEDFRALNYKMSFEVVSVLEKNDINKPDVDKRTGQIKMKRSRSHGNRDIIKLKSYPAFFANMDADYTSADEYKRFSYAEKINMNLIFIQPDGCLYELVKDPGLIAAFFIMHNFGMRSSKGFGSFYPAEDDELYMIPSAKYSFVVNAKKETIDEEYRFLFETIDLFYKTLRSGINEKGSNGETLFYFKSLVRQYCQDLLEREWEKKKIQDFVSGGNTLEKKYYDVKDLFGFSTEEAWKSYEGSPQIKKGIAVWDGAWREPTLLEKGNLPERMQSPLLFKPIYDSNKKCYFVYLKFVSGRVNMMEFLSKKCIYAKVDGRAGAVFVDLPESFKLSDFFDYIFNILNFDISTYVDEKYHDHKYYNRIGRVYNNLQKK